MTRPLDAAVHVAYHHDEDDGLALDALDERWNPDDIELRTVGIDIGSSTSHLIFSALHLRRMGRSMSSRYVVVSRETLHQSPVTLTPYRPDQTIDAEAIGALVSDAFAAAGLAPEQVESGAVILTGEAIRRVNARALADMVSERAGKLVCASAGHNLEALLAAHGSGAVELSRRTDRRVLHVDVGGGTSKLALIDAGRVLETAAVNVGGRLLAFGQDGRLERIEPAAREVAERLGIDLALGATLSAAERGRLLEALLEILLTALEGRPSELLLTDPLQPPDADVVTFSGGVSEYVYGRLREPYGDLGLELGAAIRAAAAEGRLPAPLEPVEAGVRATVLGASQYTVQVSGDTLSVSDEALLPLRNLPVLHVRLPPAAEAGAVAEAVRASYRRLDLDPAETQAAVFVDWDGSPSYGNLRSLAAGLADGLRAGLEAGRKLVLVFSSDVGRLVGELCRRECGVEAGIVSIDSVELRELDFIDIGQLVEGRRVVPVVVKSLVFNAPDGRRAELLTQES